MKKRPAALKTPGGWKQRKTTVQPRDGAVRLQPSNPTITDRNLRFPRYPASILGVHRQLPSISFDPRTILTMQLKGHNANLTAKTRNIAQRLSDAYGFHRWRSPVSYTHLTLPTIYSV